MSKKPYQKIIAMILIITQFVTTDLSNAWASSAPLAPSAVSAFNIQKLSVSEKWGRIQSRVKGKSEKTLLVIEDAHAVASAQKSIWNLIEELRERYGSFALHLEGLNEVPGLAFERSFPDRDWLRKKIEGDVQAQNISGGAAALILSQNLAPQAAETKELYFESVRLYQRALKNQAPVLKQLERAGEIIKKSKQKIYSAEAQEWDRYLTEDSLNGLQPILEVPEKILANQFPHLKSVRSQVQTQKYLKRPAVLRFWLRTLSVLEKQAATPSARLALATLQKELSSGHTPVAQSAQKLESIFQEGGISGLGALEKRLYVFALRSAREWQEIKTAELADEYHRFLIQKLSGLLTKSAQHLLLKQTLRIRLLEKLVRMELSHSEWQKVKKMRLVQAEWNVFKEFYSVQFEREQKMRKQIEVSFRNTSTVVSVMGGFHRAGLEAAAREQGWNLIVVTPSMDSLDGADRYADLMQGNVSWRSHMREVNGQINLQKAYWSYLIQAYSKDHPDQIYDLLLNWRKQLIFKLADEKRLDTVQKVAAPLHEWLAGFMPDADKQKLRTEWLHRLNNFSAQPQSSVSPKAMTQIPFLMPFESAPSYLLGKQKTEPRRLNRAGSTYAVESGRLKKPKKQIARPTNLFHFDETKAARGGRSELRIPPDDSLQWQDTQFIDSLDIPNNLIAMKALIRSLSINENYPALKIRAIHILEKLKSVRIKKESLAHFPESILGVVTHVRKLLGISPDSVRRTVASEKDNEIKLTVRFDADISESQIESFALLMQQAYQWQQPSDDKLIKVNLTDRSVTVIFKVMLSNLGYFWEILGTSSFQADRQSYLRPLSQKEIIALIHYRYRDLLESLVPDSSEYLKFQAYVNGVDGKPGLFSMIEKNDYEKTSGIVTESLNPNFVSMDDLQRLSSANPYFSSEIPEFVISEKKNHPIKKHFFLARGAGGVYLTKIMQSVMTNIDVGKYEMFFVSKDTIGYKNYSALGGFISRLIGSVDDETEDNVGDFGELESKVMKKIDDLYENHNFWRDGLNAIYDQMKGAGYLDNLEADDWIQVVDEVANGTHDFLFKYIMERRSREEGKPINVAIFIGAQRTAPSGKPVESGILNAPTMQVTELMKGFGLTRKQAIEIIHNSTHLADFMPHPLRVRPDIKRPVTGVQLPIQLETPEVLLGAYLRALLAYNGLINFFQDLPILPLENLSENDSEFEVREAAKQALRQIRSEMRDVIHHHQHSWHDVLTQLREVVIGPNMSKGIRLRPPRHAGRYRVLITPYENKLGYGNVAAAIYAARSLSALTPQGVKVVLYIDAEHQKILDKNGSDMQGIELISDLNNQPEPDLAIVTGMPIADISGAMLYDQILKTEKGLQRLHSIPGNPDKIFIPIFGAANSSENSPVSLKIKDGAFLNVVPLDFNHGYVLADAALHRRASYMRRMKRPQIIDRREKWLEKFLDHVREMDQQKIWKNGNAEHHRQVHEETLGVLRSQQDKEWVMAYFQNPGVFAAYLEKMAVDIEKRNQDIVVFAVLDDWGRKLYRQWLHWKISGWPDAENESSHPILGHNHVGYVDFGDYTTHLLSTKRPARLKGGRIRVVFVDRLPQSLFRELILLTGGLNPGKGLRQTYPNLATGDSSFSQNVSAGKLVVHDFFSGRADYFLGSEGESSEVHPDFLRGYADYFLKHMGTLEPKTKAAINLFFGRGFSQDPVLSYVGPDFREALARHAEQDLFYDMLRALPEPYGSYDGMLDRLSSIPSVAKRMQALSDDLLENRNLGRFLGAQVRQAMMSGRRSEMRILESWFNPYMQDAESLLNDDIDEILKRYRQKEPLIDPRDYLAASVVAMAWNAKGQSYSPIFYQKAAELFMRMLIRSPDLDSLRKVMIHSADLSQSPERWYAVASAWSLPGSEKFLHSLSDAHHRLVIDFLKDGVGASANLLLEQGENPFKKAAAELLIRFSGLNLDGLMAPEFEDVTREAWQRASEPRIFSFLLASLKQYDESKTTQWLELLAELHDVTASEFEVRFFAALLTLIRELHDKGNRAHADVAQQASAMARKIWEEKIQLFEKGQLDHQGLNRFLKPLADHAIQGPSRQILMGAANAALNLHLEDEEISGVVIALEKSGQDGLEMGYLLINRFRKNIPFLRSVFENTDLDIRLRYLAGGYLELSHPGRTDAVMKMTGFVFLGHHWAYQGAELVQLGEAWLKTLKEPQGTVWPQVQDRLHYSFWGTDELRAMKLILVAQIGQKLRGFLITGTMLHFGIHLQKIMSGGFWAGAFNANSDYFYGGPVLRSIVEFVVFVMAHEAGHNYIWMQSGLPVNGDQRTLKQSFFHELMADLTGLAFLELLGWDLNSVFEFMREELATDPAVDAEEPHAMSRRLILGWESELQNRGKVRTTFWMDLWSVMRNLFTFKQNGQGGTIPEVLLQPREYLITQLQQAVSIFLNPAPGAALMESDPTAKESTTRPEMRSESRRPERDSQVPDLESVPDPYLDFDYFIGQDFLHFSALKYGVQAFFVAALVSLMGHEIHSDLAFQLFGLKLNIYSSLIFASISSVVSLSVVRALLHGPFKTSNLYHIKYGVYTSITDVLGDHHTVKEEVWDWKDLRSAPRVTEHGETYIPFNGDEPGRYLGLPDQALWHDRRPLRFRIQEKAGDGWHSLAAFEIYHPSFNPEVLILKSPSLSDLPQGELILNPGAGVIAGTTLPAIGYTQLVGDEDTSHGVLIFRPRGGAPATLFRFQPDFRILVHAGDYERTYGALLYRPSEMLRTVIRKWEGLLSRAQSFAIFRFNFYLAVLLWWGPISAANAARVIYETAFRSESRVSISNKEDRLRMLNVLYGEAHSVALTAPRKPTMRPGVILIKTLYSKWHPNPKTWDYLLRLIMSEAKDGPEIGTVDPIILEAAQYLEDSGLEPLPETKPVIVTESRSGFGMMRRREFSFLSFASAAAAWMQTSALGPIAASAVLDQGYKPRYSMKKYLPWAEENGLIPPNFGWMVLDSWRLDDKNNMIYGYFARRWHLNDVYSSWLKEEPWAFDEMMEEFVRDWGSIRKVSAQDFAELRLSLTDFRNHKHKFLSMLRARISKYTGAANDKLQRASQLHQLILQLSPGIRNKLYDAIKKQNEALTSGSNGRDFDPAYEARKDMKNELNDIRARLLEIEMIEEKKWRPEAVYLSEREKSKVENKERLLSRANELRDGLELFEPDAGADNLFALPSSWWRDQIGLHNDPVINGFDFDKTAEVIEAEQRFLAHDLKMNPSRHAGRLRRLEDWISYLHQKLDTKNPGQAVRFQNILSSGSQNQLRSETRDSSRLAFSGQVREMLEPENGLKGFWNRLQDVYVFDYDKTLAEAGKPISDETAVLLAKLLLHRNRFSRKPKIVLLTARSFDEFKEEQFQFIQKLKTALTEVLSQEDFIHPASTAQIMLEAQVESYFSRSTTHYRIRGAGWKLESAFNAGMNSDESEALALKVHEKYPGFNYLPSQESVDGDIRITRARMRMNSADLGVNLAAVANEVNQMSKILSLWIHAVPLSDDTIDMVPILRPGASSFVDSRLINKDLGIDDLIARGFRNMTFVGDDLSLGDQVVFTYNRAPPDAALQKVYVGESYSDDLQGSGIVTTQSKFVAGTQEFINAILSGRSEIRFNPAIENLWVYPGMTAVEFDISIGKGANEKINFFFKYQRSPYAGKKDDSSLFIDAMHLGGGAASIKREIQVQHVNLSEDANPWFDYRNIANRWSLQVNHVRGEKTEPVEFFELKSIFEKAGLAYSPLIRQLLELVRYRDEIDSGFMKTKEPHGELLPIAYDRALHAFLEQFYESYAVSEEIRLDQSGALNEELLLEQLDDIGINYLEDRERDLAEQSDYFDAKQIPFFAFMGLYLFMGFFFYKVLTLPQIGFPEILLIVPMMFYWIVLFACNFVKWVEQARFYKKLKTYFNAETEKTEARLESFFTENRSEMRNFTEVVQKLESFSGNPAAQAVQTKFQAVRENVADILAAGQASTDPAFQRFKTDYARVGDLAIAVLFLNYLPEKIVFDALLEKHTQNGNISFGTRAAASHPKEDVWRWNKEIYQTPARETNEDFEFWILKPEFQNPVPAAEWKVALQNPYQQNREFFEPELLGNVAFKINQWDKIEKSVDRMTDLWIKEHSAAYLLKSKGSQEKPLALVASKLGEHHYSLQGKSDHYSMRDPVAEDIWARPLTGRPDIQLTDVELLGYVKEMREFRRQRAVYLRMHAYTFPEYQKQAEIYFTLAAAHAKEMDAWRAQNSRSGTSYGLSMPLGPQKPDNAFSSIEDAVVRTNDEVRDQAKIWLNKQRKTYGELAEKMRRTHHFNQYFKLLNPDSDKDIVEVLRYLLGWGYVERELSAVADPREQIDQYSLLINQHGELFVGKGYRPRARENVNLFWKERLAFELAGQRANYVEVIQPSRREMPELSAMYEGWMDLDKHSNVAVNRDRPELDPYLSQITLDYEVRFNSDPSNPDRLITDPRKIRSWQFVLAIALRNMDDKFTNFAPIELEIQNIRTLLWMKIDPDAETQPNLMRRIDPESSAPVFEIEYIDQKWRYDMTFNPEAFDAGSYDLSAMREAIQYVQSWTLNDGELIDAKLEAANVPTRAGYAAVINGNEIFTRDRMKPLLMHTAQHIEEDVARMLRLIVNDPSVVIPQRSEMRAVGMDEKADKSSRKKQFYTTILAIAAAWGVTELAAWYFGFPFLYAVYKYLDALFLDNGWPIGQLLNAGFIASITGAVTEYYSQLLSTYPGYKHGVKTRFAAFMVIRFIIGITFFVLNMYFISHLHEPFWKAAFSGAIGVTCSGWVAVHFNGYFNRRGIDKMEELGEKTGKEIDQLREDYSTANQRIKNYLAIWGRLGILLAQHLVAQVLVPASWTVTVIFVVGIFLQLYGNTMSNSKRSQIDPIKYLQANTAATLLLFFFGGAPAVSIWIFNAVMILGTAIYFARRNKIEVNLSEGVSPEVSSAAKKYFSRWNHLYRQKGISHIKVSHVRGERWYSFEFQGINAEGVDFTANFDLLGGQRAQSLFTVGGLAWPMRLLTYGFIGWKAKPDDTIFVEFDKALPRSEMRRSETRKRNIVPPAARTASSAMIDEVDHSLSASANRWMWTALISFSLSVAGIFGLTAHYAAMHDDLGLQNGIFFSGFMQIIAVISIGRMMLVELSRIFALRRLGLDLGKLSGLEAVTGVPFFEKGRKLELKPQWLILTGISAWLFVSLAERIYLYTRLNHQTESEFLILAAIQTGITLTALAAGSVWSFFKAVNLTRAQWLAAGLSLGMAAFAGAIVLSVVAVMLVIFVVLGIPVAFLSLLESIGGTSSKPRKNHSDQTRSEVRIQEIDPWLPEPVLATNLDISAEDLLQTAIRMRAHIGQVYGRHQENEKLLRTELALVEKAARQPWILALVPASEYAVIKKWVRIYQRRSEIRIVSAKEVKQRLQAGKKGKLKNLVGFQRDARGRIQPVYSVSKSFRSQRDARTMLSLFANMLPSKRVPREVPVDFVKVESQSFRKTKDWQTLPKEIQDVFSGGKILLTRPGSKSVWSLWMIAMPHEVGKFGGQTKKTIEGRSGVLMKNGLPIIVEIQGQEFLIEIKGAGSVEGGFQTGFRGKENLENADDLLGGMNEEEGVREMNSLEIMRLSYPDFKMGNTMRAVLNVIYPVTLASDAVRGDVIHMSAKTAGTSNGNDGEETKVIVYQSQIARLSPGTVRATHIFHKNKPRLSLNSLKERVYQMGFEMGKLFSAGLFPISHPENLQMNGDETFTWTDFAQIDAFESFPSQIENKNISLKQAFYKFSETYRELPGYSYWKIFRNQDKEFQSIFYGGIADALIAAGFWNEAQKQSLLSAKSEKKLKDYIWQHFFLYFQRKWHLPNAPMPEIGNKITRKNLIAVLKEQTGYFQKQIPGLQEKRAKLLAKFNLIETRLRLQRLRNMTEYDYSQQVHSDSDFARKIAMPLYHARSEMRDDQEREEPRIKPTDTEYWATVGYEDEMKEFLYKTKGELLDSSQDIPGLEEYAVKLYTSKHESGVDALKAVIYWKKSMRRFPKSSEVFFAVNHSEKIIHLISIFPEFPQYGSRAHKPGRGAALLRWIFKRYPGYEIVANANETFQGAFLKMKEFNPQVVMRQPDGWLNPVKSKKLYFRKHSTYGIVPAAPESSAKAASTADAPSSLLPLAVLRSEMHSTDVISSHENLYLRRSVGFDVGVKNDAEFQKWLAANPNWEKLIDKHEQELLIAQMEADTRQMVAMMHKISPAALKAFTRKMNAVFSDGKGVTAQATPVIFYSADIHNELLELIRMLKAAFSENPANLRISLVFTNAGDKQSFKTALAMDAAGVDFFDAAESIRLRRHLEKWKNSAGIFFAPENFVSGLQPDLRSRSVSSGILPNQILMPIVPRLIRAFGSVITVNGQTLTQSMPDLSGHFHFDGQTGWTLLDSILSSLSIFQRTFALSA